MIVSLKILHIRNIKLHKKKPTNVGFGASVLLICYQHIKSTSGNSDTKKQ